MTFLIFLTILALVTSENNTYARKDSDDKVLMIKSSTVTKVCNQVNTYTSYQECQCDQFCLKSENFKCCTDRQYCTEKDKELSCEKTLQDDIYMVNTCLPNYPQKKIISKCQTTNQTQILNDFFITLPVTSPQNITYRNIYCGLCNNVPAYVIWNLAARCENTNKTSKVDKINSTSLFDNLHVNPDGAYLSSNVDGSVFKCVTYGYPPYGWTDTVRYCGSNNEPRNCSLCEKSSSYNSCIDNNVSENSTLLFSLSLRNRYLFRDRKEYMHELIHEDKNEFFKVVDNIAQEKCFPEGNNPTCIPFHLKEGSNFFYVDDETIFVQKDGVNALYSHDQWNRTLNRDEIYICLDIAPTSTTETNFFEMKPEKLIWLLVLLSTIFLSLYLFIQVVNWKSELVSLSCKIIFSLSIALYGIYIFDQLIRPFKLFCMITAILSHYFYLSFHSWLAIAAYEYWRVICYLSQRFQIVKKVPHKNRFIIYSFIGWISPLSVIGIGMYFDSAPISTISCERRPAYGRVSNCFIQEGSREYLYSYPSTALFSVIIICFVLTTYNIYSTRCKINKSHLQSNYKKLLLKLAIGMGLPWTIDLVWMHTSNQMLQQASFFVTALQGTFIFFAFGYKKSMIQCTCPKRELIEMTPSAVKTPTILRRLGTE